MAITKTDFINYTRCPRYISLEEVKKENLEADISYSDYQKKEKEEIINELYSEMIDINDNEEIDLIDKLDIQLEAMLPYYKQVELEAGKIVEKYFKGNSIYATDTKNQESFDFCKDGILYKCYIDIYNESKNNINIIEVKATTSSKFEKLGCSIKGVKKSIFTKINNIYYLKDELNNIDMPIDKYNQNKMNLFNRFHEAGKYVYDLAVQRYIIENEYKESHNKIPNIKYFLAILNHNYVFDGTYEKDKAIYKIDNNKNELITFIDLTNVTKEYQKYIEEDEKKLRKYIMESNIDSYKLGPYCERKKKSECKFFKRICSSCIPLKNSSLNYINNGFGFKMENGDRIKGLDLINDGYINLLDIPESWIEKENHKIQRDCYIFNKEFIDKEKIKALINTIEYPIYHLDFETFPCPLPRFKGEKPYMQSPFEFSLHIEHSPGVCDKDKDNYVFLAKTMNDEREELIKKLLEYIDPNKGTLLAQNVPFEKGRIKELANIFPQYKEKLMKIYNRGFDLIWLVSTNKKIYMDLGFDEKRASRINYYNNNLSGSFSIKKTLPVFSDLSYDNLEVKNGTEAIVVYANYNNFSKEEYNIKYKGLVEYCKQDTWAMVVILDALRKLIM